MTQEEIQGKRQKVVLEATTMLLECLTETGGFEFDTAISILCKEKELVYYKLKFKQVKTKPREKTPKAKKP